jgi:putative FmdB family regulatory protein
MPTYEFRCPDGHNFEKFYRKISDAGAEVHCPVCGKVGERQLSAGAGLVFKGSGFYLTDYGKNAHRNAAPSTSAEGGGGEKSEGTSESRSDGSAEGKAESKSESKSENKAGENTAGGTKNAEKAPAAESASSKSADTKPAETKKPKPSPKSDS